MQIELLAGVLVLGLVEALVMMYIVLLVMKLVKELYYKLGVIFYIQIFQK